MMYSTEQLAGILLTTASCKFNIVNVRSTRGWEPRFFIYIRPPEKMLNAIINTLDTEEIAYSLIRERGRRIDTILIRRRHSIFRVCEIFPSFVPSKNKGWKKFKEHLEEDSKYYFKVKIDEDEEETKNIHREMGNRENHED